jgi:hypothetical protein
MNMYLWVAVSSAAFAAMWWVVAFNIDALISYSRVQQRAIHIFSALFWFQVLNTLGWLALGAFIAAITV